MVRCHGSDLVRLVGEIMVRASQPERPPGGHTSQDATPLSPNLLHSDADCETQGVDVDAEPGVHH